MGNVWYKFIDNPPNVRLFLVYNRQISIEMLNRAKTYEKKRPTWNFSIYSNEFEQKFKYCVRYAVDLCKETLINLPSPYASHILPDKNRLARIWPDPPHFI